MHSAKSRYTYFENNPFFYRQPVQISQHWCDRVKLASACDKCSGWILDFLKMTNGRCWQTIEKRISIVESRGYESMYQLLGGILRDVFSDVTDSFQMLETWTSDIIDVFFKVHVLIKHYSQISRTCAWWNVVISDVNVCGIDSFTKIWWGNKH